MYSRKSVNRTSVIRTCRSTERYAKQGESLANVATLFNIGKSTDHDKINKLQTFLTEVQDGDSIKKRRTVRRSDYDELDKAVFL